MADYQVRTRLTRVGFSTVVVSFRCLGDIRSGIVELTYKIAGENEVSINTRPAAPVPPPPDQEPPPDPANDPVQMLVNDGWTPTLFVVDPETGRRTQQPAGFSRLGVFERIDLRFEFPLFCRCPGAPAALCRVRRFELKVKYDGVSHPVISVMQSAVASCTDPAPLVVNRELRPASFGFAAAGGVRGAVAEFNGTVPCRCPGDFVGGGGYGPGQTMVDQDGPGQAVVDEDGGDGAPPPLGRRTCQVKIGVDYDYQEAQLF